MSFERRGLGALVAGLLALLVQAPAASAGELEGRFGQVQPTANRFQVGDPALGRADLDERLVLSDLRPIQEDFHPETDRWTARTNRIRITGWVGAWLFSNELRIHHDVVLGARLNWEVPGFIGIRLDSGFVPWSRMEVKGANATGGTSSRWMSGVVHSHTLSLGIFNPELSIDGLAFWAGFGAGLWFFNYSESNIFGAENGGNSINGKFSDTAFSGNIFVELDYKILDILHVGLGARLHVLMARHTDEGRFYDFNGQNQSFSKGRNDGLVDDLATVTEFTFNISVLF
ncbi:MAG: hypothetical protein M9894_24915 [Planctomycetes bacterium]|nr:hypothetical protein [Planctomycetota bacterium]